MNKLLLFDVDRTLTKSGQKIDNAMCHLLQKLNENNYTIGIVGGGKLDKILYQLNDNNNKNNYIEHYFSECGCVYHKKVQDNIQEIYIKNIRNHKLYPKINILIKKTLQYLSNVDYLITGHFIDLRNGIIYISLIGMVASLEERAYFLEKDKEFLYRKKLIDILIKESKNLNIDNQLTICEGGEVGIAIYPNEYDKTQVLEYLLPFYDEIHYFGDKYLPNGNDHNLINNNNVIGHPVDSIDDTIEILTKILLSIR